MKKEHFEKVNDAKKIKLIQKNVESKVKAQKLIQSSRSLKLKFLNQLIYVFQYVLYPLFNLEWIMEYNLQKTIDTNNGFSFEHFNGNRLTSTPANYFVNPGVGQITRLYSIYVPMYSKVSEHMIEKEKINSDQSGKGEIDDKKEDIQKNATTDLLDKIETEKEKPTIDKGIHYSLMHPKIKTSLLKLHDETSIKKLKNKKAIQQTRHKFNLY